MIIFLTGLALNLPESRSLVELTLPDETITHITNPLIGRAITIPNSFLDTLESCHVVFPNGQMYEAYPTDQIPAGPVSFASAVQPFTSCSVTFLGADVSYSGTYELISLVHHNAENYKSMTRQKFHITFIESELWQKQN